MVWPEPMNLAARHATIIVRQRPCAADGSVFPGVIPISGMFSTAFFASAILRSIRAA
jgi:hypothetical protein